MGGFSLIHWLILGIVILLLFGGNRFSAMMSDVAKGLKSFKQGLSEDDEEQKRKAEEARRLGSPERPIDVSPNRSAADPVAPPPSDHTPR
ncbi:twin-arginine translocase TatA/TatE family subunit [Sphingomonas sp. LHG3406-1]|uniref:twin-arginine translocase TatA/TatE family subunit n=1 Tax=Sphingomonas sp. LHG3406-1 TaxID=2804617 RepID=UPI00262497F7|nr:twin-arginine translocase TatA/TatE family subunit [Sphingomonas sp. LHG3406-1]